MVGDRQRGVQRRLLREEADARELIGRCRDLVAEDGDRARARIDQTDSEMQQRRLAGAVRPDEPRDVAGRDLERAADSAQRRP